MEKPFAETDTDRSRLELLYHVSRELASALELRKILTRILFLSLDTVGGGSGSIVVLDEKGNAVESAIIHTGQVYNKTTGRLRPTLQRGLAGWVKDNRVPVLIPDTSRDERWLRRPDDSPDRTGAKSAVSAPLLVRDQQVGVMTLVHPNPGFYTEEHLALVQAIADQAGIAVLNARLYEESQRQALIMSALAECAAVINAAVRLDDVFQRILEQISIALEVEAVSLALVDEETNTLDFRAAIGLAAHQVIGTRLEMGQGIAGWVAKEARPLIVPKVQQDPQFYPEVDRQTGFETRSIACAPILAQGKVIGVLEAINPAEGQFEPDAILLLTGIGSLAGTAIHNAHLFERLESAHQRYRELFEDNIDPILITNWQGRIGGANRRTVSVTGFQKDALLKMTIDELHEVDHKKLGENFSNLTSGETLSYESCLGTGDEQSVPVAVYVRQVNIDGISRLQWIFRDITERKNLDRMREDLTSMVYHDLRAPLSNVTYSLEALETMLDRDADPTIKSVLEVANRSTDRIHRLTTSLLDIQKLEAGQPIAKKEPSKLRDLVGEAIETVQTVAEGRRQEIQVAIEDDNAPLLVNADMIRRVLINLLENAIKFNPENGKIIVGSKREADFVRIWVQDEGPGVPKDEQRHIFDKFARLDPQTQGFGLGLAYGRLAIEAHGGEIWVESEPGQGARFTFTLPLDM